VSESVVETPTAEAAPAPAARQPSLEAGDSKNGNAVGKKIGIGLIVLVAAAAVWHFLSAAEVESTDDAFVDGRSSIVSPLVPGQVVSLDVADNQFVKQVQVLLQIDPRQ
jgi:membrane fusion protein, multidrug efflux system